MACRPSDRRCHGRRPGSDVRRAPRRRSRRSDAVQARCWRGRTVEAVADVFKLLGDPTRVRLVDALTPRRALRLRPGVARRPHRVGRLAPAAAAARRAARPRPPRRPAGVLLARRPSRRRPAARHAQARRGGRVVSDACCGTRATSARPAATRTTPLWRHARDARRCRSPRRAPSIAAGAWRRAGWALRWRRWPATSSRSPCRSADAGAPGLASLRARVARHQRADGHRRRRRRRARRLVRGARRSSGCSAIAQWLESRSMDARAPRDSVADDARAGRRRIVRRDGSEHADARVGRRASATSSSSGPASACPSTASSSPASRRSIRRRSPASRGRSTRRRATRCSPAPSTAPARSRSRRRAPASDSTIARIIHLVEHAQQQRAPVQTFVDRFARRYTPAVVVLAVARRDRAAARHRRPRRLDARSSAIWSYRALALLVVACPCALVISTPVSIVSALTAAARARRAHQGRRASRAARRRPRPSRSTRPAR